MNSFRKVNSLETLKLNPRAIEKAVEAFVRQSHTEESGADPVGLYHQTIESIAARTIFRANDSAQLWLAVDGGEVLAYALTHVAKDVDNKLCFWMTQAWVHPSWRGTPAVKEMYQQLRAEAKKQLCAHIIIPSSRNNDAYCRFLGRGWKPYVTLLKEDI